MINGKIALSGTGRELLANAEVRSAYLEGGKERQQIETAVEEQA
jgi:ABC-type lipopolysaccharide export system ATPase subunit